MRIAFLPLIIWILAACSAASPSPDIDQGALPNPSANSDGVRVSASHTVVSTENPRHPAAGAGTMSTHSTATATPPIRPSPTFAPDSWKSLPVIPEVEERASEIYRRGLELGRNPRAFSKVGDCGASVSWFLGPLDLGPRHFALGGHEYLVPLIDSFQGSFGRPSMAAGSGFSAATVLSPVWADPGQCLAGETPLACEYRLQNPSFALIILGTNDRWRLEAFEDQLRQILDTTIEMGIVPMIGTKGDNFEGDETINRTVAALALEYRIPLWNFWRSIQDLPGRGLEPDGVHLTWGPLQFDDSAAMSTAWTMRNLTALQALDVVWRSVTQQAPANGYPGPP